MKELNIKQGMPMSHVAVNYMVEQIISYKKHKNMKIIKVIHGYGSTGKGGKIKRVVATKLEHLKINNIIIDYIKGEDFNIFNQKVQKLITSNYNITGDCDLNNSNNGITIVVLK